MTSVTTVGSELGDSVTTQSVDVTVVETSAPSLLPHESSAPQHLSQQDLSAPQEAPITQEPDTPVHVSTTQPSKDTVVPEPATDLAECDMTGEL